MPTEVTAAIDELADRAVEGEEADTESAAPAPETSPIPVRLGDVQVELPPDQAAIIKRAFDTLHGRYGAEVDQLRAQALANMGRPDYRPPPPTQQPTAPPAIALPSSDLLFANKQAWETEFGRQLDARLAYHRQETEALVRAAVNVVFEDLNQREQKAAVQHYEGQLFQDLLEKHEKLKGNESFVWAVMDDIYDDICHFPAHIAYERLGEIAEQRWNAVGGAGGSRTAFAPGAGGRPPTTPRLLSGGRRSTSPDGQPPKRFSISDSITARQEKFLEGAHVPGGNGRGR